MWNGVKSFSSWETSAAVIQHALEKLLLFECHAQAQRINIEESICKKVMTFLTKMEFSRSIFQIFSILQENFENLPEIMNRTPSFQIFHCWLLSIGTLLWLSWQRSRICSQICHQFLKTKCSPINFRHVHGNSNINKRLHTHTHHIHISFYRFRGSNILFSLQFSRECLERFIGFVLSFHCDI